MRIEWQEKRERVNEMRFGASKRIWINCNECWMWWFHSWGCHYRQHCVSVCENPGKLVRTHSTHLNTDKRGMLSTRPSNTEQTRYKCSHCTQSFWQISIELLFYCMTAHRNYNFQFISNVVRVLSRRPICIRQPKIFAREYTVQSLNCCWKSALTPQWKDYTVCSSLMRECTHICSLISWFE